MALKKGKAKGSKKPARRAAAKKVAKPAKKATPRAGAKKTAARVAKTKPRPAAASRARVRSAKKSAAEVRTGRPARMPEPASAQGTVVKVRREEEPLPPPVMPIPQATFTF